MDLIIKNPVDTTPPKGPMPAILWQELANDFKPAIEEALLRLLAKVPKYRLSYRDNCCLDYYLDSLKEEITEFENTSSVAEAADIVNFGLMLLYHVLRKEGENVE